MELLTGIYCIQATTGSGRPRHALQLLYTAAAGSMNAYDVCSDRSSADLVRRRWIRRR